MAQSTFEGEQGTVSHDIWQPPTDLRLPSSFADSQDSSLDESLNSQLSRVRPGSAGDLDHFQRHRSHEEMTPSTSLSNHSSQEGIRRGQPNEFDKARMLAEQAPTYTPTAGSPHDQFPGPHIEHTSAPKRMANGKIKSPAYSLPSSPVDVGHFGHSRNSSRTSRNSQIGELSSQLRTRLSYAMVKVQNGWQSHNINELEVMTSTQVSPVSTVSDQRGPHESILVNIARANNSTSTRSPSRVSEARGFEGAPPQTGILNTTQDYAHSQIEDIPQEAPPSHQVGAAYESFWREHEGATASTHPKTSVSSNERPSLAPPVDLVSRNQRRPDGFKGQLPTLHTRDLDGVGSHRNSSALNLPTTPPSRNVSKIRTPSQQAAVEKDAVETLLFMSSPGNSGYHPPTVLPGTPLRNESAAHMIRTDLAALRHEGAAGHNRFSTMPRLTPRPNRPISDAEIEKMLDEMPDTSSSDDDDFQDKRASLQSLRS